MSKQPTIIKKTQDWRSLYKKAKEYNSYKKEAG